MVDNLEASIGRANSNEWLDDIERQYVEGMADGLVKQYDDEFLGRLRQIKHAGVPLSLIALARPKQAAYQLRDDTARLLMAGCNDSATYFYGKINRLDMAFGYDPNVSCSWIEQDGWVIDATAGWMVEQDLFYEIERPETSGKRTKQECANFAAGWSLLNELDGDVPDETEETLAAIMIAIPSYEAQARAGKFVQSERFLDELQLWKDSFEDYDGLVEQLIQEREDADKELKVLRGE